MAKVSVIMGIYNAADTLARALESVANQTLADVELILCDDGSEDASASVAADFAARYPGRVVLLKNQENRGLGAALNRCLAAARGEYIARMDADDVSLSHRLERQAGWLDCHPEDALVGCAMIHFDEDGDYRVSCPPERPQLRDYLLGTPFCHGTVMVRREAYRAVGGYRENRDTLRVEDVDLWLRLYEKGFRGRNLTEPMYRMLDDRHAASRRKFRWRVNSARIRFRAAGRLRASVWYRILALRPVAIGLLPGPVYRYLHRKKWENKT